MSRTIQAHEHVPTDETRGLVSVWAMVGTPHEVIASELKISADTLTRRYGPELHEARQRGVAKVAATLYSKAIGGDVAAVIFYLKTQGKLHGWIDRPDAQAPVIVQLDVVKSIEQAFTSMKRAGSSGASAAPRTIEHKAATLDDGRDLL